MTTTTNTHKIHSYARRDWATEARVDFDARTIGQVRGHSMIEAAAIYAREMHTADLWATVRFLIDDKAMSPTDALAAARAEFTRQLLGHRFNPMSRSTGTAVNLDEDLRTAAIADFLDKTQYLI